MTLHNHHFYKYFVVVLFCTEWEDLFKLNLFLRSPLKADASKQMLEYNCCLILVATKYKVIHLNENISLFSDGLASVMLQLNLLLVRVFCWLANIKHMKKKTNLVLNILKSHWVFETSYQRHDKVPLECKPQRFAKRRKWI